MTGSLCKVKERGGWLLLRRRVYGERGGLGVCPGLRPVILDTSLFIVYICFFLTFDY